MGTSGDAECGMAQWRPSVSVSVCVFITHVDGGPVFVHECECVCVSWYALTGDAECEVHAD